jgi:hypothetical protein
MDTIERDFEYDQKIEDVTVKLELLILKAMSSVLDSLMQAYWTDSKVNNKQTNDDVDWPF